MKRFFSGFFAAVSMFTIIPSPACWHKDAFCRVIPSLPFVGLIIGALWYAFAVLLLRAGVPIALASSALLIFPLFVSGFIHIDGLMDASDAIFSRAPLPKKREILKDSHVGAFAVIAFGVYLIVGYSAVFSIVERAGKHCFVAFVFIPVLSRCVAGIALLFAKPMTDTGFGADFRRDASVVHKLVLISASVAAFASGFFFGTNVVYTLIGLLAGGLCSAVYSIKQMDGVSGDLCGFIIAASELSALITAAVA